MRIWISIHRIIISKITHLLTLPFQYAWAEFAKVVPAKVD